MIKVTKSGKKIFNVKCEHCGCEFTYELEDLKRVGITTYGVYCPECRWECVHPSQDTKMNSNEEVLNEPQKVRLDFASFCNHEWECCGIETAGTNYRCRKCGATKTEYVPYYSHYTTLNSTEE